MTNKAVSGEKNGRCRLCGHACGAERNAGEKGLCGAGAAIEISSVNLHHGEEPPISGARGSGTIFFTHCPLKCVFCQNYPISALGNGSSVSTEELASEMLKLRKRGAHNINLVSPTHYAAQIAEAVSLAREKGLDIPIVYNTGGYEHPETIGLLKDTVDVYMPDVKYASGETALKYSGAADYPEINRAAVKEMFAQKGRLAMSPDGTARRGLLIRHLVLPGLAGESKKVLDFIAGEISPETHISIMSQYHPAHRAAEFPPLARRLARSEYAEVLDYAEKLGFANAYIQHF